MSEMSNTDYWIEWNGGERPVPEDTRVTVRFRDGKERADRAGTWRMCWLNYNHPDDIVAYKVEPSKAGIPLDPTGKPYFSLSEGAWVSENPTALAQQVGGDHYKSLAIQPVEYIHRNKIGYFEGNVIKYVTRWRDKNGIADLQKAKHYIDLLIELEGK